MMEVEVDEDLLELDRAYVGKLLYDGDLGKAFKVTAIQFRKWNNKDIYEATVIRVEPDGSGGWSMPLSAFVAGTDTIKQAELESFFLMDITDESAPNLTPDVDETIAAFGSGEEEEKEKEKAATGSGPALACGKAKKRQKR